MKTWKDYSYYKFTFVLSQEFTLKIGIGKYNNYFTVHRIQYIVTLVIMYKYNNKILT